MLFSSIEFLYYFLPATILIYFLIPMPGGSPAFRNYWLLFSSLVFYMWGGPWYLVLITAQSLAGWLFGLLIENRRGKKGAKLALAGAVLVGLSGLIFFKYTDFFLANINAAFKSSIPLLKIALPLGISFNTFQLLSYDIDLYYGKIKLQRNFFTLFAYVVLFPQLIAGPIVRYSTVERELSSRKHSIDMAAAGVRRFVIGLGKKVLIANVLGEFVEYYRAGGERSLIGAWVYIITYAFHLYFDFSGYSDMAIGMGKIFGFNFLENFNYPYISRSVTEFWRRWHISMSSWFRDYIYIPLGGNRVKLPRRIFNIMAVWFVTGFWHGAGWNYIAWGLYFGVIMLFEKYVFGRALEKIPRLFAHVYIIICIAVGWNLFDSDSLGMAIERISCLFGAGTEGIISRDTLYYLRSYLVPLAVAAVGCTPGPARIASKLAKPVATIIEPLAVGALLIVVTAYLADGSFNPFIYFRF